MKMNHADMDDFHDMDDMNDMDFTTTWYNHGNDPQLRLFCLPAWQTTGDHLACSTCSSQQFGMEGYGPTELASIHLGMCPPVMSWLMNPMNTIS